MTKEEVVHDGEEAEQDHKSDSSVIQFCSQQIEFFAVTRNSVEQSGSSAQNSCSHAKQNNSHAMKKFVLLFDSSPIHTQHSQKSEKTGSKQMRPNLMILNYEKKRRQTKEKGTTLKVSL